MMDVTGDEVRRLLTAVDIGKPLVLTTPVKNDDIGSLVV
jgi:hypothetical protein